MSENYTGSLLSGAIVSPQASALSWGGDLLTLIAQPGAKP